MGRGGTKLRYVGVHPESSAYMNLAETHPIYRLNIPDKVEDGTIGVEEVDRQRIFVELNAMEEGKLRGDGITVRKISVRELRLLVRFDIYQVNGVP